MSERTNWRISGVCGSPKICADGPCSQILPWFMKIVRSGMTAHGLTRRRASPYINHMVECSEATLDGVFGALADPTRRAMLRRLADAERTIGDLAAPFAMSLEAASKHVRVLERAGLVRRRIEGRRHVCRIEPRPLEVADSWLRVYEPFWTARLDRLEQALRGEGTGEGKETANG